MVVVHLRPLARHDAETFAAWGEDPKFARAAEWSAASLDERTRFWRSMVADPPADLVRLAAVTGGRPVGYVDIHGIGDRRELGFAVGREYWGQGFGNALARAGLSFAFEHLDLDSVWAEAWAANLRSIAILTKVGMRHLGAGDEGIFLDQKTRYEQFELRREEWSGSAWH